MAIANKLIIWIFSLLMLMATVAAAFFHELWILAIPVILAAIIVLVQYPQLLLYVLIATVPWSVEFNFTPTLGTDLPDEPLMLLSAYVMLGIIFYRKKQFRLQDIHPLLFLMIIQLVWIIITVLASTFPLPSLKFFLAKSWYLLAFVALPLYVFRDRIRLQKATIVLFISMMIFMFLAMIRHAGNGWTFEKINDSLQPFYRNHVNYSALLVMMVPLQLAFMRYTRSKKLKWVLKGLLLITLAALYFSYARGAWLALVTGLAGYWLLRKKLLFFTVILGIVITIITVFALKHNDHYLEYAHDFKTTVFHTDFREHLLATYQMKDVSTAERFYRWIAGVRMIPDNWQTGIGPSTFYRNYKSYAVPAFKTWVSRNEEQSTVHNYFLLLIIEQGVVGLLIFLAFLFSLFWYVQHIYHRTEDRFWKTVISTIGSILVMICTVNFLSDLIETDKVGSVFYLSVTAIIIADLATRKPNAKSIKN